MKSYMHLTIKYFKIDNFLVKDPYFCHKLLYICYNFFYFSNAKQTELAIRESIIP